MGAYLIIEPIKPNFQKEVALACFFLNSSKHEHFQMRVGN